MQTDTNQPTYACVWQLKVKHLIKTNVIKSGKKSEYSYMLENIKGGIISSLALISKYFTNKVLKH